MCCLEKILKDTRGLSQKKLYMSSSYSFEPCHHGRPGRAHYNTKFLTLGYYLELYCSDRIDILLYFNFQIYSGMGE